MCCPDLTCSTRTRGLPALRVWNALCLTLLTLLLAACGGGSSSGGSSSSSGVSIVGNSIPGANVMTVTVDCGPGTTPNQSCASYPNYYVNRLYANVTICQPGTNNCQTIDHVLVDTGSTGLRLLASAVSGSLGLATGTLHACQQYVDGSYTWGPVVNADVRLGNAGLMTASSLPIQLVQAQTNTGSTTCPQGSGAAITSTTSLGAKGILGIGLFAEDCGASCVGSALAGFYYQCTGGACTGTTLPRASQIANPVSRFATDNNGLAVVLPTVTGSTATSLSGAVLFGIGTQSNNQPGSARLLTTNGSGYITTTSALGTQTISFLDTGSNGLFFGQNNPPTVPPPFTTCASQPWYCPAAPVVGSATLLGVSGGSAVASYTVSNATSMFSTFDPVLPSLAGWASASSNTMFDWGLPFFYGKTVFIGIEGKSSPISTGPSYPPYFAF